MSLSKLIRKRDSLPIATAIPATSATQTGKYAGTVARVATVAVARPKERKHAPMTNQAVTAVMGWLASIEETDPETIDYVLTQCRIEPDALDYFLWRASGGDE